MKVFPLFVLLFLGLDPDGNAHAAVTSHNATVRHFFEQEDLFACVQKPNQAHGAEWKYLFSKGKSSKMDTPDPVKKKGASLARFGLILGILSLVILGTLLLIAIAAKSEIFGYIAYFLFIAGAIVSPLGIIISSLGLSRTEKGSKSRREATLGLLFNISLIILVLFAMLLFI